MLINQTTSDLAEWTKVCIVGADCSGSLGFIRLAKRSSQDDLAFSKRPTSFNLKIREPEQDIPWIAQRCAGGGFRDFFTIHRKPRGHFVHVDFRRLVAGPQHEPMRGRGIRNEVSNVRLALEFETKVGDIECRVD